jgi:L-seryl-tRNA(Ser) seleniumtransferase
VEVGTTNRTHPQDYRQALGPETAAVLRVHSSNFRQIGFVAEPALEELAAIAHAHRRADGAGTLLIDDLGSGSLLDTAAYGLAREPMVQESLAAGADVVTFSGDKLLGGPQAGLISGRGDLIARVRSHPLARALRVDKMTLAALDATLRAYQRGRGVDEIPVWQMIAAPVARLQTQAEAWAVYLRGRGIAGATVWTGESAVGGGSLPGETLPTALLAVAHPDADGVAARLRAASPPVVCRIQRDHLLFDPRTVLPGQEEELLAAVADVVGQGTWT